MVTTRQYLSVETEFIHWILLIIAAIAILLAIATALAADPMSGRPMLPPATGQSTAPMSSDRLERPFFPEDPPQSDRAAFETAGNLWMILEHQRAGCTADALAAWEQTRLPSRTAVWREIGMAAAYLQADDLPQALGRLELAEGLAPHHPVVAYLRGKVWFELANRSGDMKEERPPDEAREPAPPQTSMVRRAVYELMAIADLQEAIERADVIDPAEPLVMIGVVNGQTNSAPRVGELLAALGEDRFVGQAHSLLFRLHLGRHELTEAEQQLDEAAAAGVAALDGHRHLATAMLEAGEQTAAVRVLGKDVRLHYPWIHQGCQQLWKWTEGTEPWLW